MAVRVRAVTSIRILLVAAISLGTLTSVHAQEPRAGDAGAGPIKIGHYGSLTGSEATFGQSTDNGIKLAVKEANAAGGVNGRRIELITYDDKGDTKETGAVVTRLVAQDEVVAVLGEVASKLSLAAAPVCRAANVPMITPSSTNPRVTMKGTMISRVCFIDPFQAYVCAKFAWDHQKVTRVATLYDQASPYSTGLAREFRASFEALGGTITTEQTYNAGDQDFTAQLTRIRRTDPEMIFVPGYYTDVGSIALQARKLGIKVPLIGGDGWDSSKLAEIGGKAIEGCFYSNHYSPQNPNPRVQKFIEDYRAAYGATPDGLAALGYDAANLLFDAMKRSPSLSGKDLAAAIASTKDFPGVTGIITLDKDRNAVKPAVILEMINGEWKYVTTIDPPDQPIVAKSHVLGRSQKSSESALADFLQALTASLAVGSLYALIALGYTMVYGILKFINFAHSDIVVWGAWISYKIARNILPLLGINPNEAPWWASAAVLILSMLACGAGGFAIERLAYKPLRKAPRLNVLITAIGVSLLLQNVGQLPFVFGSQPATMPELLPDRELVSVAFASAEANHPVRLVIGTVDATIFVTAAAFMVLLEFLVYRTKLGTAMRAVSYNINLAALMGINVSRVISFTFVMGSALAAAAGFLFVMKYPTLSQPAHATWMLLGLKAFVAAVVGGIGNVRGAVLGGFAIAFIEQFGAAYISSSLRDVYVFTILIGVLLFKPTGLLGKTVREKV